jgi:CheY-like chemotaxis protein
MRGAFCPCDDQPMARTVLIVDNHAPFRALARAMLQLEGFEVVDDAADARSALDAVRRLRPSVVLLDIQLPHLDGFEVARRLARAGDPPAIVLPLAVVAAVQGGYLDAGGAERRARLPALVAASAVALVLGLASWCCSLRSRIGCRRDWCCGGALRAGGGKRPSEVIALFGDAAHPGAVLSEQLAARHGQ